MELLGIVERRRVATGSKSERDAVVLRTAEGSYHLRRRGGHPLQDENLEALVGMRIRAQGSIAGPTFILDSWEKHSEKTC